MVPLGIVRLIDIKVYKRLIQDKRLLVFGNFVLAAQVLPGLGVIGWSWYLPDGPTYTIIHDSFFDAFALPPFHWDFGFSVYFKLPLWERLFSFNLGEFELFGISITVQLLTLGFSLLRRSIVLCISEKAGGAAREKAEQTVEIEMVSNKLQGTV
jgi:hypothetical protein